MENKVLRHGSAKVKTVEGLVELYVANLAKYNEGIYRGEWITLPTDNQVIAEVIARVLGQDEEIAIHDYITDLGLKIGEYDNIYELNNLLNEVEEYDKDLLGALIRNYGLTLEEGIAALDDTHYIQLDTNTFISDEENLAYSLVESIGDLESTLGDRISNYFDWESFGRDLSFDIDMILEGIEEEEKEEYYNMSDEQLAEWYIFDVLGNVEELGKETLERYFNYKSFGYDLWSDYTIDYKTMIATCNY